MEITGLASYAIFTVTLIGIFAILALGLNMQWGYTGMLNIGVAGFFAVGAYTTALLTSPQSEVHVGGFGLPFLIGALGAIAVAGVVAFLIGLITLNLRSDYLAIATIGIAEIIRLFLKTEAWLTNGVRGIAGIPRPVSGIAEGADELLFMLLVFAFVGLIYYIIERSYVSPWGRVLRAIREREPATLAAGKNVLNFRLQAFAIGAMAMGLAGALYAHFVTFISPEAFRPEFATFLIWVMLIAGGSGNNRGALLGTFVIWLVWSGTEFLTGQLPDGWATRAGALRVLLIGVLLQIILITRPQGLLPERPPPVPGARE
ncbi:MAG: branched-chain amino acid ABC transporter permease [Gammaproteobacteria bacterium]|nr:branched-chain amino acid ABC transporter permease [Gammaproteobacteria bacterium]NIR85399.1 branched-chain amino acid ABC transporter permease [Gammaproteobacteria bacterium]NIR88917.1 branched-chain amino acid ABC transporter permease [Gammaproteobacteria bacterium]NIU06525.1 branched-chain amino acid ABC transporter permease [Gammaproteobacteria bacterium]NIV53418.1 branched-chain amino acid ABC transporter permease [Gammaproteobacteria bacterium]